MSTAERKPAVRCFLRVKSKEKKGRVIAPHFRNAKGIFFELAHPMNRIIELFELFRIYMKQNDKRGKIMNYLWAGMILVGLIFSACNGTLPDMTNAALDSAKEAITLCITMTGVMSFWVGLMRIAENAGIIAGLSRRLKPFLRFLFPNLPEDDEAGTYIATNMIANVFGLGWAATPAGLKAMEALTRLEEERRAGKQRGSVRPMPPGTANDEMCVFLIVNISSLQLIPMNIIAYRGQYGSVNPAAVVGPGLAATICSTLAALVFCKAVSGRRK